MRKLHTILSAALLIASTPAIALASDSQIDRVTLTGLPAISVVVENPSPIGEKNGLDGAAIQTDIERRLRAAGIPIVPDADAYLYVHVTVADPGGTLPLPYLVEVALMQEVTLPRGLRTRTPLQCPTWSLNSLGLVSSSALRTSVTTRINEFVDQFVTAFRSVNPK
jgi:hypothetical protein